MIPVQEFGELRAVTSVYQTNQLNPEATGALIFLHGSGDDGNCFRLNVHQLLSEQARFPHIKVLYPSSWKVSYSPFGNLPATTWYDISSLSAKGREHKMQLYKATQDLLKIIDKLVSDGIPRSRIVVGGFSRGGAMSAHLALCSAPDLAGVGIMSSWIPDHSDLYPCVRENAKRGRLPQLLHMHGDKDNLIKLSLAQGTFDELRSLGVDGKFVVYPGQSHEVSRQELRDFFAFVSEVVPQ